MDISSKRHMQLVAGPYTQLLAEHEAALARLYDVYAETLLDNAAFWKAMADEERAHLEIIKGIEEKIRNGVWCFSRPGFVSSAVIESCDRIQQQCAEVETGGTTMRAALQVAMSIEHGMIESEYFEVVRNDDPEMMAVLQALALRSFTHAKNLEREAGRLKWKIAGGRKHVPAMKSRLLSREEIQERIKSTQARMVGLLVFLEESVGRLYDIYSRRLPGASAFWAGLAVEEQRHSAMLAQLYAILERGKVFYNVRTFNAVDVMKCIERVIAHEFAARSQELSRYQAINTALVLERTLTEGHFYSTVKSDAPEFQLIADRMVKCSRDHIKRLEQEAGNTIDLGAEAKIPAPPLLD